ncbi:sperm acrosome developmental regulator-like isoform X1 [Paramacrobiotus metropolitanus]|uniref:sperm acrosome developmental regulator-like isoform X1 n=1 Tax=Paramacrobiotus metropolitanus TaxID=2943436 RepID=UPI0024460895|nr:sperm acrosome developmental regulator-like isoform X1 [Paramacrobiotus metropolitanus]XP_055349239.1 sperm acrosome developmental regulator-like isoform X1 [Paramacrobiotus metropolitanus]
MDLGPLDPVSGSTSSSELKSPTSSDSASKLPGAAPSSQYSSAANDNKAGSATLIARGKRGNLSHLSESDRRSEVSYRSEPSLAISDAARSSKFKVVKLGDKTPYVRGRFTCFDFHDLPVKDLIRSDSSHTPRIQTPTIATEGPSGTLTASASFTSSGNNTADSSASVSVQVDAGSQAPASTSASASSSRTGTLIRSPLSVQTLHHKSPSSRSPVPPNTPTSPNVDFSASLDGASTPDRFIPSPAPTTPIPGHAAPDQLIQDSLAKKNPTPYSESVSRVASMPPSGTMTPGRKISGATGPDPSKLLRLKGESFFAEMIDRVWEVSPGKPVGGGFDRIEAKIQQCMSLVTEHVLLAVRSDLEDLNKQVKVLRERAASLECENQVLKMENTLLRNVVNNSTQPDITPSRSRMK